MNRTYTRWESSWANRKHYVWNRQSCRHVLIASSCSVQAFILCNAGSPSSKNVARGAKITSDNILHSLAFRIPHRATRQQLLSMRTSTPLPHAPQVLPFAMGRTRLHVLTPHKRQMAGTQSSQKEVVITLHYCISCAQALQDKENVCYTERSVFSRF